MLLRGVAVAALTLTCTGGCAEKVAWTDPRLRPLIEAIEASDRATLGFSPIARSGTVRLESTPGRGYDAALHVDGPPRRFIAFRKARSGYEWIGEEEYTEGPGIYRHVDGNFHEAISIAYEKVGLSGLRLGQMVVSYDGEDPRIKAREPLTAEEARDIVGNWARGRSRVPRAT